MRPVSQLDPRCLAEWGLRRLLWASNSCGSWRSTLAASVARHGSQLALYFGGLVLRQLNLERLAWPGAVSNGNSLLLFAPHRQADILSLNFCQCPALRPALCAWVEYCLEEIKWAHYRVVPTPSGVLLVFRTEALRNLLVVGDCEWPERLLLWLEPNEDPSRHPSPHKKLDRASSGLAGILRA